MICFAFNCSVIRLFCCFNLLSCTINLRWWILENMIVFGIFLFSENCICRRIFGSCLASYIILLLLCLLFDSKLFLKFHTQTLLKNTRFQANTSLKLPTSNWGCFYGVLVFQAGFTFARFHQNAGLQTASHFFFLTENLVTQQTFKLLNGITLRKFLVKVFSKSFKSCFKKLLRLSIKNIQTTNFQKEIPEKVSLKKLPP